MKLSKVYQKMTNPKITQPQLNKPKYLILKIVSVLPFIGLGLSTFLNLFVNSVAPFSPTSLVSKIIHFIYASGNFILFSYPIAFISIITLFTLLIRKRMKNEYMSISDKAYLIICPLLFLGFIIGIISAMNVYHQFQLQKDIF